ncbi:rho GTPase-activating protein 20-like isoform X2 [Lytechinus variegatus]|uniref:rho GTPase-activating protein 20-like isoform X2 n=1 Tax=Lytechinus variegatus TaxID=7654 RepID=UPI001BB25026|nr:rho GTPase-activating protein 20-like isoform X2 [Lytechinus variegatus]
MREYLPIMFQTRDEFFGGLASKVQRVSQYDKVLHNLLEDSSKSRTGHPRDHESLLDPEQTVREIVKEREEEMCQAENESKLLQIQERFTHDELNLFGAKEMTKQQKFKALSTRRRSAPVTVIKSALTTSSKLKTIQDKSNNNNSPEGSMLELGSLSASLNLPSVGSRDIPSPTSEAPPCKRLYIMEGPVHISVGPQIQNRYLVLMNDTLLIAKPKSATSLRLKHRLRVGELWLNTCIDEVSEVIKSHDCSFVLGWPTNNVVLTFASNQERELWWQKLSTHIEVKRKEDEGKSVQVRVLNRDQEYSAFPSKTLQIGNHQHSSDLLDMAMQEFGMPEEARNDFQLWVQSGREDSLYPLIGHEYPYAIKMSHIRDAQDKPSDVVFSTEMDHLSSAENELREHQCQFIIRRKGKTATGGIDSSAIQRRLKKGRKSPFKLSFKRSISNKDGSSPGSSPLSPHARLFGLPLSMVCPENTLPKPILDLLTTLYHQAPFMTGIFRKSANARVCRELREALDAGEQCSLDDVSVHVAASVLKDFLRSLPDSLLVCSQCEEWISTIDIADKEEKLQAIKSLLDQLLDINQVLLRHLFNVLYYVSLHMDENNMNSYNLSICVAPSMLWPPANAGPATQAMATKKIPAVVEFIIDNVKEVFGDDVLTLFGEPPVQATERRRHDSSGDSDSMNEVSPFIKRDDSSLDSIEKEFFANDNEQEPNGAIHKWTYGNTPVLSPSTLSRDSGITSSDNQLYPDSDNTDTTDSGMDSKEKLSVVPNASGRPAKISAQFSDDLFWRQRRGSEPAPISKEAARHRMALLASSANNTADNSPEISDQESYNLSEDTLKLIKDLNRDCSSNLLNAMLPEDMRSNSRKSSASGSGLQINEKGLVPSNTQSVNSMPTTPTEEDPVHSISYGRRQSVPSIGSGSPTFPRRLTSSRRSASSMSSSSSERMSDAQSSSSSERLHSTKLGMKPQRTEIDMTKTLQAASSNTGRLSPHGGPNMGQHGFQPTYKKMFMNSDTRGLPSRPNALPVRPRHHPRPSQTKEATPPREFFPKDATTRSTTLSQSPRSLPTHQEQTEKRTPPMKRNSSPSIAIGQHTKQRVSKTQSDSSQSRTTPPTYQEAMNRRAFLQRSTKSLDSEVLTVASDQSPRRRSAEANVAKHRHEDRPGKPKRHLTAGGIIFLDSDTDSSDDNGDYRNGYGSGKGRGVRRTSSDSVATNRKGSSTSVQRSSSDTAKPAGNEVRTKQQQRNAENTRRSSQPVPPRRRHHNGEVPRRTSAGNHPGRRQPEPTNSSKSSDPVSGRSTALHFPFPDPRAEPPSSPLTSPRSKANMDAKNGLKKVSGNEQTVSQARADWQRKKTSIGKDLKITVHDLANIDYTDESYV